MLYVRNILFLLSELPERVPEAKLLGGEEDGEQEIKTEGSKGNDCLVFSLN